MISNLLLGQEIVMIYWARNCILDTGSAAKTAAQSAVKNCTGIGYGTSRSYNVPTNFRLELLEPPAREVEGLARSEPCSPNSPSPALSSRPESKK